MVDRRTAPLGGPQLAGAQVAAECGCRGRVRTVMNGPFPVAYVVVAEPCESGHPGRIAAGVTERWVPGALTVLQDAA